MEAIAWDDNPEYFQSLALPLRKHGITLKVYSDPEVFLAAYADPDKKWNLILLDLYDVGQDAKGSQEARGLSLARAIQQRSRQIPIYLVTSMINTVNAEDLGLTDLMFIKSKDLKPNWLVNEILGDLKRTGAYSDRRKVFLIHGRGRGAQLDTEVVKSHLKGLGLDICTFDFSDPMEEPNVKLMGLMRDCGAIIGLLTPDRLDSRSQMGLPDASVIYGCGVAMGLTGKNQKQFILQKWGLEKKDQTDIPYILKRVSGTRYSQIQIALPKLDEHLRRLQFQLES